MNFPTVVIKGTVIVKLGGMWYTEGGDGEMYPVVGQKECNELYEVEKNMKEVTTWPTVRM